jgi:hypothetical protein
MHNNTAINKNGDARQGNQIRQIPESVQLKDGQVIPYRAPKGVTKKKEAQRKGFQIPERSKRSFGKFAVCYVWPLNLRTRRSASPVSIARSE